MITIIFQAPIFPKRKTKLIQKVITLKIEILLKYVYQNFSQKIEFIFFSYTQKYHNRAQKKIHFINAIENIK